MLETKQAASIEPQFAESDMKRINMLHKQKECAVCSPIPNAVAAIALLLAVVAQVVSIVGSPAYGIAPQLDSPTAMRLVGIGHLLRLVGEGTLLVSLLWGLWPSSRLPRRTFVATLLFYALYHLLAAFAYLSFTLSNVQTYMFIFMMLYTLFALTLSLSLAVCYEGRVKSVAIFFGLATLFSAAAFWIPNATLDLVSQALGKIFAVIFAVKLFKLLKQ